MDEIKILIDFGSTYTKVVAVDLDRVEIIARAYVPSTVETDITIGLKGALEIIRRNAKIGNINRKQALACSSAAGGLRMICIGFVPDYTSKATNYAALGAGAKIIGSFSYELNSDEVKNIEALAPDIILLSGGTDGGNYKTITHNARQLARANDHVQNIIVAGNKSTYDEIKDIFKDSKKHIYFTENVMPELKKLNLEPCKNIVRELFIRNIIQAKGITKAREIIEDVIMPTPAAILEAARLIAAGYGNFDGFGELMLVDVGGATTDVYSIGKGLPGGANVILEGIPEPYKKRTVEGDLGLKHNIDTLAGFYYCEKSILPDEDNIVKLFQEGQLPTTENQWLYHTILSRLAVETAVSRHVGRIDILYTPQGEVMMQHGKNLTDISCIIGTGGPLIYSSNPRQVLAGAEFNPERPNILKPKSPVYYLDQSYILYAIGLLCLSNPVEALALAKKYIVQLN